MSKTQEKLSTKNNSEEDIIISYNKREYKIDKEKLNALVKRVWIDKEFELNTTKQIYTFLKKKGILIEEFLEHVSFSWVELE